MKRLWLVWAAVAVIVAGLGWLLASLYFLRWIDCVADRLRRARLDRALSGRAARPALDQARAAQARPAHHLREVDVKAARDDKAREAALKLRRRFSRRARPDRRRPGRPVRAAAVAAPPIADPRHLGISAAVRREPHDRAARGARARLDLRPHRQGRSPRTRRISASSSCRPSARTSRRRSPRCLASCHISAADKDRVMRAARRQSGYFPVLVTEGLTWRQFALLSVLAPQLPGVRADRATYRHYMHGSSMAHVVGYVGMADKAEVDEDPMMRVPGFRTGKAGIEKSFDRRAQGTARHHQIRGRRPWPRGARAWRDAERARQGPGSHHRSGAAGDRAQADRGPAHRLHRRARRDDGRDPGDGLLPHLRSQRRVLQGQSRALEGARQRQGSSAGESRAARRLSAGLDLQGGDRARRPRGRRHHARRAHDLPRRPTSSAAIASAAGSATAPASTCIRRSSSPATSISTRRRSGWASTGSPRRRARSASARSTTSAWSGQKQAIIPDTAWKKSGAAATLVSRRDHQLRHRPGLCLGHAASARGRGGAHRHGQGGLAALDRQGRATTPEPALLNIDPVHLELVRAGMVAVVNEPGGTGGALGAGHPRRADGGKDRHLASDQREEPRLSQRLGRRDACAVHRLRAGRRAALRRGLRRRAWRRRIARGGSRRAAT